MASADHGGSGVRPAHVAAPDDAVIRPLVGKFAGDLLAGDHAAKHGTGLGTARLAQLGAMEALQAYRRAADDERVAVADTGMPEEITRLAETSLGREKPADPERDEEQHGHLGPTPAGSPGHGKEP